MTHIQFAGELLLDLSAYLKGEIITVIIILQFKCEPPNLCIMK